MFKRKKKDVIEQSYNIEKYKDSFTPEEAKEISMAVRSYTYAAQFFEKHIAEEEKAKVKQFKRLCFFSVVLLSCQLRLFYCLPH